MSRIIRGLSLLLLCALLLCACSCSACSQNKKVVATCGEYEIYYELIRFATLNFKDELEAAYGDDDDSNGTIWDDPETAKQYAPLLEEKVWGLIRDNFAVLAACEEYGIGLDVFEGDEVTAAVDEQMDALIASYDSYLDYEAALEASYMTEDVFRFFFAIEEMKTQLYNAMKKSRAFITDKEAFSEWLADDNCVYVQHVMRKTDEGEDSALDMQLMQEMLTNIKAGTHDVAYYIDSAMNEDTSNVAPYYIIPHAYDQVLVDAALDLRRVGSVSDVITVDESTYYLLVRMEEGENTLAESLGSLLSLYQWGIVSERVEAVKANLKITKTDYGKELDILTIE